jgi:hypothetical protein
MINDVNNLWTESWNVCKGDLDLTNARIGGKATKVNPNKEDINFWQTSGPLWVEQYIAWRKANTNWNIWITPDGRPAIELELVPTIGGVPVKMVIDRIFEVDGRLVILDLKTAKNTPISTLQLGFYKVGLEVAFGQEVYERGLWGNYYHKLLSIHVRTDRSLSILNKEGSINGRRMETTSII